MRRRPQTGWQFGAKKLFDRAAASVLLVLTAPVLGIVALGVWATMGRPIFFVQSRPGRNGVPFRLIKFRTMTIDDGAAPSRDSERLTPLGRCLRGWSLDEIPQLINVLRGEMSLVGPRPLLMQYLPRYTLEQARRHDVLPGITGWAQVHGRNMLSWEAKLRLD